MTKFKKDTQNQILALQNTVASLNSLVNSNYRIFAENHVTTNKAARSDFKELSQRIRKLEDDYSVRFTPDEFETVKQQIVQHTLAQVGVHSPAFVQEVTKTFSLKVQK